MKFQVMKVLNFECSFCGLQGAVGVFFDRLEKPI